MLTKRAKGGKKRLKKLWGALEEMGAVVTRYADPVVKYHAKYLVADDSTAIITTLNPTRKCFTRTWDAVLITQDPSVVKGLLTLFKADAAGVPLPSRRPLGRRLIVGPERSRAGDSRADREREAQHPHPRSQAVGSGRRRRCCASAAPKASPCRCSASSRWAASCRTAR